MSEARDHFPHLENMSVTELHERRDELTRSAPDGDYKLLSDDALSELFVITRMLRRHSAPASKSKSAPKAPPTLEELA